MAPEWLRHDPEHFPILYGDDGEMQCAACMIDFKRASVEDIMDRFSLIGMKKWMAAQKKEG